jgi:hypothetical protein
MTKFWTRYLITAAMLVVAFCPVYGQGGQEQRREQCRQELQRTDELIGEARAAIQSSSNAIGAQALERAEQFQRGAREAFGQDAFVLATGLTRKAREQASAAISRSRQSEQFEGVLNGRLERAKDDLERARDRFEPPLDPTVATLYDQARNYLAQAWEFYRGRKFRAAGKMVEQVEQATRRLQNLSKSAQGGDESFEFRLQAVERLVEYSRELLADCGSQTGRQQLDQAAESLRQARELQADNRSRAALAALGSARQAARRAARECRDGSLLEQRYQRLVKELDQIKSRLAESDREHGSTATAELVRQASEQLELAHRYLAKNETESVLLSLQAAQIALRQAERYLNGER